jgi:hypothetical protein
MRSAFLILPLALLAAPAAAQERLPILDMHLPPVPVKLTIGHLFMPLRR